MATSVLGSIISHRNYFTLFVLFLFFSSFTSSAVGLVNQSSSAPFNRSSFPPGFLFGAASSAYQDDVKLLKYLGLDTFRLSISWPRVLPHGKLSKGVNKEGIAYYNNVINELLANGITPFVTLFHWDLPQALEDEYTGFLSPLIVDDFRDFSELCFKEFGDRVKYWITFNEPFTFTSGGYDGEFLGSLAPGRCSSCPQGNSATEPYVVAHHILLAHAASVKLYREKYQATQKGEIGITLVTHWFVPYSSSRLDIKAAQRALDFVYGCTSDSMTRLTTDRNGMGDQNNETLQNSINDPQRVDFYSGHLNAVRRAIGQGVNVKGFIAWSFLDNFEWGSGYTQRFGLCYVDYKNGLKRIPKQSALWFRNGLIKK
ncbi:hypothetical protein DH2020_045477 [Rehmannia glutinosa]|uniref:Beta-glucosidase n=1 Tax=Rehmannia glutinosa TaxID=99300 RepID=A0ABR0UE78_REHGL